MRTKHLLAAVTTGISTATALAAPASADAQLDQAFLKGLKEKGIIVPDGEALISLLPCSV